MATKYTLIADRFVHLVTEGKNHDVVERTRYSKGDTLPDLSKSEVKRLLDAGAIAPADEVEDDGLDEGSPQEPVIKTATDDDPTNVGTVVTDLGNSGDESPDGEDGEDDEEQEEPTPVGLDYDSWDYEQIKVEAANREVTGPDGSLKKKDLLAAIKAHDAS